MHWCDVNEQSFEDELETAKKHYIYEVNEEKESC